MKKKQVSNPATKKNTKKKKQWKKILKILQVITIIAQILIPIILWIATSRFNNTLYLFQLYNAIQDKSDAYYSAELKGTENEQIIARSALLNTYELACQQYLNNKIDRKAFKAYYDVLIKEIMTTYLHDTELYQSIYKVYTEWYGKPATQE